MRIRVRPRHMLVFAVRGKRKFQGFYTPQVGNYADHYQLQSVWIAEMGEGCNSPKDGIQIGTKACVLDVYELETLPKDVFQHYYSRNPDLFRGVIEEAKEYDGVITSEVIHEDSLVGVVEDACQILSNSPLVGPKLPEMMS